MIKINLLPVRAVKKKETAKQQISILLISVVGVLAIALAIYSVTLAKISAAKDEIARSEQEIQRLKTKIGEINNIKKLQAEVKKKLDVLNQLRKEKTGPASRLAKLSDAVPDKLWLTKYAETGGNVSIAGVAPNEDLIADFMRNLHASGEFINVELMVSEQTVIGGEKLKKFEVTCSLKNVNKEEPATPQKK
ncbi:MAG: type IV pilus assembly protein [Geobacteraceae bacterium]|nr:MAG: type IV pilus assembly protein [Geobacteraceae bacterium]